MWVMWVKTRVMKPPPCWAPIRADKNPPFELRQFNSLPLKIGRLGAKRKGSSSYHHELQGQAVKNFGEVTMNNKKQLPMGTSGAHSPKFASQSPKK